MEREAQRSLDPLQAWHKVAANSLPGLSTLVFDKDLTILLSEGEPMRSPGIDPGKLEGRQLKDTIPDDLWKRLEPCLEAALKGENSTFEMPLSDGEALFWVGIRPLRTSGSVVGGVITSHEVAQRMVAEHDLLKSTESFEVAFNSAPIGMTLVALDGSLIRVNPAFCSLLGYTEQELAHMKYPDLVRTEDLEDDLRQANRLFTGELNTYSQEKRYVTSSGDEVWVLQATSLVRDEDGNPVHMIAQLQDLSERKDLEGELRRVAEEDLMTGLANRRKFVRALDSEIERCRRYGHTAALLMIDLDNFKAVNDTYGHAVGDELLRHFGNRLEDRLRSNDLAARLGGDEFTVILVGSGAEQSALLAGALMDYFDNQPFEFDGKTISCRASIGSVEINSATESTDEALSAADRAMYEVKAGRKSR